MSDSISSAQFGSPGVTPCPDCGGAGQPDGPRSFSHAGEIPGDCRTYTWSSGGVFIARDRHPKKVRDERADKFDARLRKLNPFTR